MAYRFLDRQLRLPSSPNGIETRFEENDGWQMTDAERSALASLLREVRPEVAIEVGTFRGGSLDVLSRSSDKVYSLDIDPAFGDQHGSDYPNVEFVVGYSQDTLPALIDDVGRRGERLGFVLIDGDHSEAAVRTDINNMLRHTPTCPLYVVMHDSFNPGCRKGILAADWAGNPHVHLVETDYVTGRLFGGEADSERRSMWCGFALAVLLPEPRTGAVRIHQNDDLMYRIAYRNSVHLYRSAWNPFFVVPRAVDALRRSARRFASASLKRVAPRVHARLKQGP